MLTKIIPLSCELKKAPSGGSATEPNVSFNLEANLLIKSNSQLLLD